jgi:thiosulfate dehydrogenase
MRPSALYTLGLGLCLSAAGAAHAGDELPHHVLPASPNGNLVIGLCDGETSIELPGVKAGDTLTRAEAQKVADTLMQEWRLKHPGAQWVTAAAPRQTAQAEAPATETAPGSPKAQFQTYGAFTERDQRIWQASTDALVAEGKRIFHDPKALGSTDGISCDMCHPDAANTHPETYPKFQVQLGRVALLRDMINWCIENPVRGKPFADDDPRLKALEAYILAQRKGTPLDYGRH